MKYTSYIKPVYFIVLKPILGDKLLTALVTF